MPAPDTSSELSELPYPDDPRRVIRLRVEGPAGYRERGEPLPHVIVLHGFKGFMHWGFFPELSRRIGGAGMVAVSFNASGSGVGADLESFTELEAFARDTHSRQLEDLDRVREHVLDVLPAVRRDRLGALGHSRGGGMVLLHAARHGDYRALVTWASIAEVPRHDEATRAEWRARGYTEVVNARTGQVLRIATDVLDDVERNAERLDVLAACRRIQAPTLVVHGTADEAVDPAAAERIVAALPNGRLLRVEGAGHTFGARHPPGPVPADLERVHRATLEHLAEHLAGQGPVRE